MSQELALKFSSAPVEQLLSILPPDEVVGIIRDRLRPELVAEIENDYSSRIAVAEDEASENFSSMETFKNSYEGLAEEVKKAIELPWTQALPMLKAALEEYNPYED